MARICRSTRYVGRYTPKMICSRRRHKRLAVNTTTHHIKTPYVPNAHVRACVRACPRFRIHPLSWATRLSRYAHIHINMLTTRDNHLSLIINTIRRPVYRVSYALIITIYIIIINWSRACTCTWECHACFCGLRHPSIKASSVVLGGNDTTANINKPGEVRFILFAGVSSIVRDKLIDGEAEAILEGCVEVRTCVLPSLNVLRYFWHRIIPFSRNVLLC